MAQVFYISQDEEILSVISRLRASKMLENTFVIPKRSIVLASGVNLRLLAREAEKLGRRIVIVTQDEEGRMLAEKVGIPTKPYSEELLQERGPRERAVAPVERAVVESPEPEPQMEEEPAVPQEDLGSAEFFAPASSDAPPKHPSDGLFKLRVRDNTPKRLTALNSKRSSDAETRRPSTEPSKRPASGRLSQIFASSNPDRPTVKSKKPARARRGTPEPERSVSGGESGHSWFLFFVGVSLLFLLGTAALLLLPKAMVDVVPKSAAKSKELSFTGKVGAGGGEREIPIRVAEHTEEVTVTVESTGTPSSSGQKAQGSVVIYNAYSDASQPLVATTRLETPDGLIFRITKGVTVPGMTEGGEPGAVEVVVVADQTGEAYNVGPSEFTIPGFKGNPKFEKFSARSGSGMKGGATGGGDGVATVSKEDLRRAGEEAKRVFRERFESAMAERSEGDERFAPDSVEIAVSGNTIAPEAGFAATSFEYRATYIGKTFLFSEGELRREAERILNADASFHGSYSAEDLTLEYLPTDPDYGAESYPLSVRATALFVAQVDLGGLRNDLLGRRLDDMESVLRTHPEIERLDISWPLPTALPKKVRQIELTVLDAGA